MIRDKIRNEIINSWASPGRYQLFKQSIDCGDAIDEWTFAAIDTLDYKVNKHLLIIETDKVDEVKVFIKNQLCPVLDGIPLIGYSNDVHRNFMSFIEVSKSNQKAILDENFIVYEQNLNSCTPPSCDKRLASYFTVVEKWTLPQRKNDVVIRIDNMFNDLVYDNPNAIWNCIYNMRHNLYF